MGPSVGTVVPSHDARYLREALASLLHQTVGHEILVVDDASPGGESRRVARALGVRCIRVSDSIGGSEARNLGIEEIGTPWVLNFDHDNVAEPRMVERLLEAAVRRPRTGVAYCTPRQIGMAHGPHPGVRRGTEGELATENFIDASSLFSRQAWEEAGGFDGAAGTYADWDLWLGMVERGWRIAYVPEMLFRYRIHASSMMQSAGEAVRLGFEHHVRRKHAAFDARRGPKESARRIIVGMRARRERVALERDPDGPTKLVLVGARLDGQAGVVLDTIADGLPYQVVAFLDETVELWGERVEGIPVYGGPQDHLGRALEQGARQAMVSIGDSAARERLAGPLVDAGLELATLIHPRSYVAPSARVGAGVFVAAMCGIAAHATLGDHVMMQGNAYVGHDAVLEPAVTLAPGVTIGGRVRIGRRAFLGLGSVILPDVTVGDDAIVGAGAVVREDVAPGTTVVGVPAREIQR